jgi:hypothetical protein
MKPTKVRKPPTAEQVERLVALLAEVPERKVVVREWGTDPGRAFVKELRRQQVSGVPLSWLAESLNASTDALNGAVQYYERRGKRGKKRRPSYKYVDARVRPPRPPAEPVRDDTADDG